jgi:hypothetical protein
MTDQRALTLVLASCLILILGGLAAGRVDIWLRDKAIRRRAGKRKGMLGGR